MVGATGCSNNLTKESESDVITPVLAVKKLSSGTDSNNHSYVTFNYTITPANASDRSIITELTWTEEGTESDFPMEYYLSCSVNENNSTITVTCLQPFIVQANLNITCASNSDCYVDLLIDYEVKLTDFNFSYAHLDATAAYTSNGLSINPWWYGTCDSLDNTQSQWFIQSTQFSNYSSFNQNANFFNFPFNNFRSSAAVYSLGTVDEDHETLSVSYSLSRIICSSYISLTTSLQDKLEDFFESDILPNCLDYVYMDADSFDYSASTWAATNLTSSEASELHSKTITLNFDLDVTFSGSNGVSKTQSIRFYYQIDGRFFDVPVRSFSTDGEDVIF